MMSKWRTASRNQVAGWLRTGISPRRLALTLALGFAIGCLPVIGIPTALCIGVAMVLRLNVPAIQAANYLAMPLQLMLMLPFVRLGGWMFASGAQQPLESALLHGSPMQMLSASGSTASHALAGWLVIAGPMVLVLTLALTAVFQRLPALAAQSSRS
jgi:uncharacterized protein (DUF2062 family)